MTRNFEKTLSTVFTEEFNVLYTSPSKKQKMKKPRPSTKQLGYIFETKAAAYLQKLGYRILARNYRFLRGEIDIIAETTTAELVFCEVKYRKQTKAMEEAFPIEASLSELKKKNIIACAKGFLQENPQHQEKQARYDCLLFHRKQKNKETKNSAESETLIHLQNAFYEQSEIK